MLSLKKENRIFQNFQNVRRIASDILRNWEYWLMAARPKTLPIMLGPMIIGLTLAKKDVPFSFLGAFLILSTGILLQIAANFANDYYDFKNHIDTKDRIGPTRVCVQGLLPPIYVRNAFISCISLAAIITIILSFLASSLLLLYLVLAIAGLYFYSAGTRPLSHRALGETLAWFYFGPFAVSGIYLAQTGQFSIASIFHGIPVGFIAAAVLAINNLRDIETDKQSGKKTIASIYGEQLGRKFVLALLLMSLVQPHLLFTLIPFGLFYKVWDHIAFSTNPDEELNKSLVLTACYLVAFACFYSIGVALSS